MNWQFTVQIAITSVVAVVSWIVAHRLTAMRDLRNKQREIRLQYLMAAYRGLAMAVNRRPNSEYVEGLEAAIHDIQLFGSESQIEKLNRFLDQSSQEGRGEVDTLLEDLRADLRAQLQLPPTHWGYRWWRAISNNKAENEEPKKQIEVSKTR